MALSERIATARPASRHGTPCSVGALLDTLEGAELDALKLMLGTPEQRGWTAGEIYGALIAEGHKVSYQQINRHRSVPPQCRCPKASA